MTEITEADLPAHFAAVIIFAHNRMGFAAERDTLNPKAEVFRFTLHKTRNELIRISKVPRYEAFLPDNMRLGFTWHEKVALKDLIPLMKGAIEAAQPKPKLPEVIKGRLRDVGRKPG